MNIDFVLLFAFGLLLSVFLYFNRKKLLFQKILGPVIYIIMYRTNVGLALMDKVSSKYRELVKFIATVFIGFAFLGLFWGSLQILFVMLKFFVAPATTNTGVGLVIPGTSIPGIGYLPFFYWIIAIFITAAVHEFAHGVVARAHNLKVKSSGIAFVGLILPVVPAAFVEPDDKEISKKSDIIQYSVYAAGPLINITLALIILMALPYVADTTGSVPAPFESSMTIPAGFSVSLTNNTYPAAMAGLKDNSTIIFYNTQRVNNSAQFLETMYYCVKPGDKVTIGTAERNYTMTAIPSPDDPNRGVIGVTNFKNEVRVKQEYKGIAPAYFWVKDLIAWIFRFNFFIGFANLLPLFMTDGAKMLQILFERLFTDKKRAASAWTAVNSMFLLLLIIGLVGPTLVKFIF